MEYYITNGHDYIKLVNSLPTTCSLKRCAQTFSSEKADNIIKHLPKYLSRLNFTKIADDKIESVQLENEKTKYNQYQYKVKTAIEDIEDIPNALKFIVNFVSELDNYIENMEYLQKELELKILDVRHFIRDENVKLSASQMAKIGYMLRDYERQRKQCKMNKTYCELFQKDLNRLRNKEYIEKISDIQNSEYKPRRISFSELNKAVGKC